MQTLSNFCLKKTSKPHGLFNPFVNFQENTSYVPISGCVLEHIITALELSNLEKLYYILADSLAIISSNSGKQRAVALPSNKWAKRLNCSKSQIFTLQKNLESKGYFIIYKEKNICGQNKRNLIMPTLPESIFARLSNEVNRIGEHQPYDNLTECKRGYLDRTKLFIKLNYQLLQTITSTEYLNPFHKILWLDFYTTSYKLNISIKGKNIKPVQNFYLIISYKNLVERYACDRKHLSRSIKVLEEIGFISLERFFIKKDHAEQDRQDQSLHKITLLLPVDSPQGANQVKTITNLDALSSQITYNYKYNFLPNEPIKIDLEKTTTLEIEEVVNVDLKNIVKEDTDAITKRFSKLDNNQNKRAGTFSNPEGVNSSLLLNKNLKSKIEDIKSNLSAMPKVLFDKFLKKLKGKDYIKSKSFKKDKEFNICSELIKLKLKKLSQEKADKARKFAYSLYTKKLTQGYAATLDKHELAKHLIFHAATWKPIKCGELSREKEIDIALSVAWKSMEVGTWKMPLELAKAQVLQYEFESHKEKYKNSGVISNELKDLESEINKILGGWVNLENIIIKEIPNIDLSNVNEEQNEISHPHENLLIDLNIIKEDLFKEQTVKSKSLELNHIVDGLLKNIFDKNQNTESKLNIDEQRKQVIDISHISDEQRILKITPSNINNQLCIETIDNKHYFCKLKMMEVNEEGDLVMTLKRNLKTSIDILFIDSN